MLLAPVCVLALALAQDGSKDPLDSGFAELRTVLCRAHPGESRTPAELVTRLAALGPEAVPALYAMVTGAGFDALIGEEWVPSAWFCRPEEIPGVCANALERAPTEAVLAQVELALSGEPSFQERLVQLRILAGQGRAEGLELVLRGARELGEVELGRPSVRAALEGALEAILRRDGHALARIEKELEHLEPILAESVVAALAGSERPEAMATLERAFRLGTPARDHVARAMAELELARPWQLEGRTFRTCGAWLRGQDPDLRAQGARLAGRLHALSALPELVDLTDPARELDPGVRRCALEALEAMAGIPLEPVGLEAWLAREESWKEERFDGLLETVVRGEPGAAKESLHELARHPLYRHQTARSLAESLSSQPLVVARLSCDELGRIGSRQALPGLLDVAEHLPRLRVAAAGAMRRITGETRELTPELWRRLVGT